MSKVVPLTLTQAMVQMRKYCDRAERCESEVLAKIQTWGFSREEAMGIHADLIVEGYVSERRYAEAFAHDKSKFNRWGRRKIEMELKRKGISERNIADALRGIEGEAESEMLMALIQKKEPQLKGLQLYQKRAKWMRYLLSKGFTSEQSSEAIDRYLSV